MWLATVAHWMNQPLFELIIYPILPISYYEFNPLDLILVKNEYARPPPVGVS